MIMAKFGFGHRFHDLKYFEDSFYLFFNFLEFILNLGHCYKNF